MMDHRVASEEAFDQKSTISTASSSLLLFRRSNGCKTKKIMSPGVAHQPLLSPSSSSSSSTPVTMRSTSASKEEAATSQVSSMSSRRGSTRVARLASLFSSRAVVKGSSTKKTMSEPRPASKASSSSSSPTKKPSSTAATKRRPVRSTNDVNASSQNDNSAPVPPSPSHSSTTNHSSSSSAYVGWPGTQDKRGGTVAIQSSYDDSSVGTGGGFAHRMNYEQELEHSAQEEVKKWMSVRKEKKLTPLEQRIVNGPVEQSSEEESDGEENPADFHLAAVVANAAAAASSPLAPVPTKNQPNENKGPLRTSPSKNGSNRARSEANGNSYLQTKRALYNSRQRQTARSTSGGRSTVSSASGAISIQDLFGGKKNVSELPAPVNNPRASYKGDPWDVDSSSYHTSSPSTSVSKDSSLYFPSNGNAALKFPGIDENSARGVVRPRPLSSMLATSAIIRPPTEEALAANDRFSPPHRTFNATNGRGYRGFIDKTRDVPNLMDAVDSDSMTSSRGTSTLSSVAHESFRIRSKLATTTESDASDVFDGVTSEVGAPNVGAEKRAQTPTDSNDELNVVVLPSGLASIQTPQRDFDNRQTSADYDETLTNSDVDQYGFIKLPHFEQAAGKQQQLSATFMQPAEVTTSDSSTGGARRRHRIRETIPSRHAERLLETSTESESSGSFLYPDSYQRGGYGPYSPSGESYDEGDLSMYCVHPNAVKKLVRKYRKMCNSAGVSFEQAQVEEDAKKAFALFEMRSRIMEKDIERGLERQGGTVTVDDLVLTPYNQAAQRVRDAVIVSKAWRDGASPRDVITASLLTRRDERAYYIPRPRSSPRMSYTMEEVQWIDDTDFMQLRCPSLGPRCMRGFEMFTIGDCQSILLKLTNERCMQLRAELNDATARQIEAEEKMKAEEADSGMDHGIMTEAEMTYLTSMEEVKALSKQLVVAERAFHLVRDRIEQLVARYETLLVRIENESVAASSVITFDSSYYSDYDSSHYDTEEDREKEQLARRAQRAEIKAELAAREALLAKQEAQKNMEEKQRELEELQQRLVELQSEPSHAIPEREHSIILAKAIAANSGRSPSVDAQSAYERSQVLSAHSKDGHQQRVDGVKQKFRDRMAERIKRGSPETSRTPTQRPRGSPRSRNLLSGEEMFQHLDFYERSLKSVEKQRVGVQ